MKKAVCLFLVLLLCFGLCACGGEAQSSGTHTTVNDTTEDAEGLILYDETEGYSFVNQARLRELVTSVELTVENWADYITVCAYTEVYAEKDAFGEIVSTETYPRYVLGAKDNRYYFFRGFTIELQDKDTGELRIYEGNSATTPFVTEDFQLEQYQCTRVKGEIYWIDIPEGALEQAADGTRFFRVRFRDPSYGPEWIIPIIGIGGYAVGGGIDLVLF